jgi:hypothetical protein
VNFAEVEGSLSLCERIHRKLNSLDMDSFHRRREKDQVMQQAGQQEKEQKDGWDEEKKFS